MFSFGIVMWELLTGDEPYADLHYGAIIGDILLITCHLCKHAWLVFGLIGSRNADSELLYIGRWYCEQYIAATNP